MTETGTEDVGTRCPRMALINDIYEMLDMTVPFLDERDRIEAEKISQNELVDFV